MASFHEKEFIKTALEVTELEGKIKLLVSQKDKIDVELHHKGVTELVRQHDEVCRELEEKRLLQKSLQEKNSRMLLIISKSKCPADYQTPIKKVKLCPEFTSKPAAHASVNQSTPSSTSSSKSSVRTPSSSLIKKCKVSTKRVKEDMAFMSDDELIAASQQLFDSQQLFSPSPKCTLDESIKLLEDRGESNEMKENDEKMKKEDHEDGEGKRKSEETKKGGITEVNGEEKKTEDGEDSELDGAEKTE